MDALLLLTLGIIIVQLRSLIRRNDRFWFYHDPAVHDGAHPVFSRKQVRGARMQFDGDVPQNTPVETSRLA